MGAVTEQNQGRKFCRNTLSVGHKREEIGGERGYHMNWSTMVMMAQET